MQTYWLLALLHELAQTSFSFLHLLLTQILPLVVILISSLLSRIFHSLASLFARSPTCRAPSSSSNLPLVQGFSDTRQPDDDDYYDCTQEQVYDYYGEDALEDEAYYETQQEEFDNEDGKPEQPQDGNSRLIKLSEEEDRSAKGSASVPEDELTYEMDSNKSSDHDPPTSDPMYPPEPSVDGADGTGHLNSPKAQTLPPTFSMLESRLRELSNQVESEGESKERFNNAIEEETGSTGDEADENSTLGPSELVRNESDTFMDQFQEHFKLDK